MANFSIFGTTPGPTTSAAPEGALNLAHQINVSVTCWALGIRFWRVDDMAGAITGRLWRSTGPGTGTAVAGSDVTFTLGAEGWTTAQFAAPIELAPGNYKAAVHFPERWPITSSYWQTGGAGENGHTAGPLTAPNNAAATDAQGSFSSGAITNYPFGNPGSAPNYWVDLLVTDTDPEGGQVADHTVAAGEQGVHAITLTAGTVVSVQFDDDVSEVEIVNMTGTAPVYFAFGDTDPTVAGKNTRLIPAAVTSVEVEPPTSGPTLVKLISSGTPTVSVARS